MKPTRTVTLGALALVVTLIAFEGGRRAGRSAARREALSAALSAPKRTAVVAMARLEPASQLVRVSAPLVDTVARILVKEGEAVKVGQELAVVETNAMRRLERDSARLRAQQAALKLRGVEAQRAALRQAEAALANANDEVTRTKTLLDRGLVSAREYDTMIFQARRSQDDVSQARTALVQAEESTRLAQAEAENAVALAERQLEQTVVRAPITGSVLRILARPGERAVGPVVELGQTGRMSAVAEVHSTEIHFVRAGQKAEFTSPSLEAPLAGEVQSVGMMINYRNIFGEDSSAVTNAKVFEVRVTLAPDPRVGRFSNLEGQMRIFVDSPVAPTPGGGV
jgi:HlyD family secretion protein